MDTEYLLLRAQRIYTSTQHGVASRFSGGGQKQCARAHSESIMRAKRARDACIGACVCVPYAEANMHTTPPALSISFGGGDGERARHVRSSSAPLVGSTPAVRELYVFFYVC